MKLHVNRGRASAQHAGRVSADSEWDMLHILRHLNEVSEHCDVCMACGRATHVPFAGTFTVSMFNGKLRIDLPFVDDIITSHVTDVSSKYSPLTPVRPENPQGVRGAVSNLFPDIWAGRMEGGSLD